MKIFRMFFLICVVLFEASPVFMAVTENELYNLIEQVRRADPISIDLSNKAIAVAGEGIKSDDLDVRESAIYLYEELVKKGKAFEEAIAAAGEGIKSDNYGVSFSAIELYKALVEKGEAFQEAISVAGEGIKSYDMMVRSSAIYLYKALIEKDQAFKEAIAAAGEGIKSDNRDVRSSAIQLYEALFEKGKAFEEAITVAREGIKSDDFRVRVSAIRLYEELVKKGKAFEEATVAAREEIKSDNFRVRILVIQLYKALVEKGKTFKEAITVAGEGIKSYNYGFSLSAIYLYKALIEKDQAFKEAIAAAGEMIKSDYLRVRFLALDLYKALFEKDQAFKETIAAAGEMIKSDDSDVRKSAVKLYKALIEKLTSLVKQGKNFEGAIGAAEKGVNSNNDEVQNLALNLLKELENKVKDKEYDVNHLSILILCISNWEELKKINLNIDDDVSFALEYVASFDLQQIQENKSIIVKLLSVLKLNEDKLSEEQKESLSKILKNNKELLSEIKLEAFLSKLGEIKKELTELDIKLKLPSESNGIFFTNLKKNLVKYLKHIDELNIFLIQYKTLLLQLPEDKDKNQQEKLNKIKDFERVLSKVRIEAFYTFLNITNYLTKKNKQFGISDINAGICEEQRVDNKIQVQLINPMTKFMIQGIATENNPFENLLKNKWNTEITKENMEKITGEAFADVVDEAGITRILFSQLSKTLCIEDDNNAWFNASDDFFVPVKKTGENTSFNKSNEEVSQKILKALGYFMFYSLKNRKEASIFLHMPTFVFDFLLYGKETNYLNEGQLNKSLIKWIDYLVQYNKASYIKEYASSFSKIFNSKITVKDVNKIIGNLEMIDDEVSIEEIKDAKEITADFLKTIKKSIIESINKMLIQKDVYNGLTVLRKAFWDLNGNNGVLTRDERLGFLLDEYTENQIIDNLQNPEFQLNLFQIFLEFLQPEDLAKIFYPTITVESIKIKYEGGASNSEKGKKIKEYIEKYLDGYKDNSKQLELFVKFITGGLFPDDIIIVVNYLTGSTSIRFDAHTCSKRFDITINEEKPIIEYEKFKKQLDFIL